MTAAMPVEPLLAGPVMLLATVLVVSGAAKVRAPGDLDEFARLGVPAPLRRTAIVRLHPWGELVLGVALLLVGGWIGLALAAAATLLMTVYLVLVVRTIRITPDATCSCFGSARRITVVTVVRNAWLVVVGVFATLAMPALPTAGGAVTMLGGAGWSWAALAAASALTTALILWPETPGASAPAPPPESAPVAGDALEYVRTITPAVPVTLADGSSRTLRDLTAARPMLMLAVSSTCGSCVTTIARAPRWRELLPEVDIRFLVTTTPEATALTDLAEPTTLHDPANGVGPSLGYRLTPSAVLFGVDGMLAGGPVTGEDDIAAFVGDVYESLHGVRPDDGRLTGQGAASP